MTILTMTRMANELFFDVKSTTDPISWTLHVNDEHALSVIQAQCVVLEITLSQWETLEVGAVVGFLLQASIVFIKRWWSYLDQLNPIKGRSSRLMRTGLDSSRSHQ